MYLSVLRHTCLMLNASFSVGTDALTASTTIIRGHRLQRKVDIRRIPLAVRISGHTNMVVNPGFMNLALMLKGWCWQPSQTCLGLLSPKQLNLQKIKL